MQSDKGNYKKKYSRDFMVQEPYKLSVVKFSLATLDSVLYTSNALRSLVGPILVLDSTYRNKRINAKDLKFDKAQWRWLLLYLDSLIFSDVAKLAYLWQRPSLF